MRPDVHVLVLPSLYYSAVERIQDDSKSNFLVKYCITTSSEPGKTWSQWFLYIQTRACLVV